jgi:hypothetical protein
MPNYKSFGMGFQGFHKVAGFVKASARLPPLAAEKRDFGVWLTNHTPNPNLSRYFVKTVHGIRAENHTHKVLKHVALLRNDSTDWTLNMA